MSNLSLRRAYAMVGKDMESRLRVVQDRKTNIESELKHVELEHQSLSLRLALHDAVASGDVNKVAEIADKAVSSLEQRHD